MIISVAFFCCFEMKPVSFNCRHRKLTVLFSFQHNNMRRKKKKADDVHERRILKTSCASEVIHETAVMYHIQPAAGNSGGKKNFKGACCVCLADLCKKVGNSGLT